MACGGGLYLPAIFATMLIYLSLHVLGILERRFNLKPIAMNYIIVSEKSADDLVAEINSILEDQNKEMQTMRLSKVSGKEKIFFSVDGTRNEHRELAARLRQSDDLRNFETIAGYEIE
jgi:putative Mg2+ transporter-C (MgtC) family protein